MLTSCTLEMHMIVEVRLGAALNGARSIPDNIGRVNHPMNQSVFLKRLQRTVQRNAVGLRPQRLLNLTTRQRIIRVEQHLEHAPAHRRMAQGMAGEGLGN